MLVHLMLNLDAPDEVYNTLIGQDARSEICRAVISRALQCETETMGPPRWEVRVTRDLTPDRHESADVRCLVHLTGVVAQSKVDYGLALQMLSDVVTVAISRALQPNQVGLVYVRIFLDREIWWLDNYTSIIENTLEIWRTDDDTPQRRILEFLEFEEKGKDN